MPEIIVLRHSPTEPLGLIEPALKDSGLNFRYVRGYDGESIPDNVGDAPALIVMGGPQGVYEQADHPYLTDELRLIERAIAGDTPVLGVCLGAQLVASALGADVRKGDAAEIGWFEVAFNALVSSDPLWSAAPHSFTAFHWHGDYFKLPNGAVSLASSDMTPSQIYRFGDAVYGIQFHMEVTEEIIRGWTREYEGQTNVAGIDVAAILAGVPTYLAAQQAVSREVFGRWARAVASMDGRSGA
jgi:GMP synthase (glutamine-hydrolysing)